mgnify:CR=1 FL=1
MEVHIISETNESDELRTVKKKVNARNLDGWILKVERGK